MPQAGRRHRPCVGRASVLLVLALAAVTVLRRRQPPKRDGHRHHCQRSCVGHDRLHRVFSISPARDPHASPRHRAARSRRTVIGSCWGTAESVTQASATIVAPTRAAGEAKAAAPARATAERGGGPRRHLHRRPHELPPTCSGGGKYRGGRQRR
jgi:hypothetical protein